MRLSWISLFVVLPLALSRCGPDSRVDDEGDDDAGGSSNGGSGQGGTVGGDAGAPSSGGSSSGTDGDAGAAGDDATTGGSGGVSGTGGAAGGGAGIGGDTCATTLTRDPVDFIIVADNSGSMFDKLAAIEQAINTELPTILTDLAIDYRVVLITRHRRGPRSGLETEADTSVCVAQPLSSLATCPAPDPGFSARFFHYNVKVESTDALDWLLDGYSLPSPENEDLAPNGYGPWLRGGVEKAIIIATDDDEDILTADAFLDQLTQLSPENFGIDADGVNFAFHSIVGIREKADPLAAYLPSEPVLADVCTGNASDIVSAGVTYQELSIRTNGVRFPLCQFTGYGAVFRAVAEDTSVCDFAVPEPPLGEVLDLTAAVVTVSPEGTAPRVELARVASPNDCRADAFFVENDHVFLCPAACSALWTGAGSIEIAFPCE